MNEGNNVPTLEQLAFEALINKYDIRDIVNYPTGKYRETYLLRDKIGWRPWWPKLVTQKRSIILLLKNMVYSINTNEPRNIRTYLGIGAFNNFYYDNFPNLYNKSRDCLIDLNCKIFNIFKFANPIILFIVFQKCYFKRWKSRQIPRTFQLMREKSSLYDELIKLGIPLTEPVSRNGQPIYSDNQVFPLNWRNDTELLIYAIHIYGITQYFLPEILSNPKIMRFIQSYMS